MDPRVLLVLHLPKCGGQTLNHLVFRHCHDEAAGTAEEDWFLRGVGWFPRQREAFLKQDTFDIDERTRRVLQRPDLRAFIGHFSYGIHELVPRSWTYCTVLRHPIDRLISLHHHVRHLLDMTLEQFVAEPPYREVDNDQTRRISGDDPPVGGCTEEMLRKAKAHLESDFVAVGVTERFEETVVLLKRLLGWQGDGLSSRRRNVSRDRTGVAALSSVLRAQIVKRNELDLELYEHACRLLDRSVSQQDSSFADEVQTLAARNRALSPMYFVD